MLPPVVNLLVLLLLDQTVVEAVPDAPLLVVVTSQKDKFHQEVAARTVDSINKQWDQMVPEHVMNRPKIITTHDIEPDSDTDLAYTGWTIFPLMPLIWLEMSASPSLQWVAVLAENTELNIRKHR